MYILTYSDKTIHSRYIETYEVGDKFVSAKTNHEFLKINLNKVFRKGGMLYTFMLTDDKRKFKDNIAKALELNRYHLIKQLESINKELEALYG